MSSKFDDIVEMIKQITIRVLPNYKSGGLATGFVSAKNASTVMNKPRLESSHVSGIVYCRAKTTCEAVARVLTNAGFVAGVYHADVSDRQTISTKWVNNEIDIVCYRCFVCCSFLLFFSFS